MGDHYERLSKRTPLTPPGLVAMLNIRYTTVYSIALISNGGIKMGVYDAFRRLAFDMSF